jgi:hypothetical protein
MQQVTIELPTTIINALAAYNQEHKVSSSDAVQTAIESFLIAKGYLSKPKKSFHLSPAPKGSGYTDTSINHDAVLAEFTACFYIYFARLQLAFFTQGQ